MIHEQWFISDTHLFHANILKFIGKDGARIRPFSSLKEMHDKIVKEWNAVVGANDYVYHLGDVTFQYHNHFVALMHSLNGSKRLIVGNHDKLKNTHLLSCFKKVVMWRGFKEHNFTASHVPIHPGSIRHGKFNVHGHLHQNLVPDLRYINVCVEHTDYRPLHITEIRQIIKERMTYGEVCPD